MVDFLHEGMKMHPAFLGNGQVGKEQVHQHRLAAPDAAPQVKALRRCDRLGEQPGKQADLAVCVRLDPDAQSFQPRQHGMLGGVGAQGACGDLGFVNLGQRHSHTVVYRLRRALGSPSRAVRNGKDYGAASGRGLGSQRGEGGGAMSGFPALERPVGGSLIVHASESWYDDVASGRFDFFEKLAAKAQAEGRTTGLMRAKGAASVAALRQAGHVHVLIGPRQPVG
ncbi:MAG: hypothetical protein ACD_54C00406G0002, partial [uncultured bacterium]